VTVSGSVAAIDDREDAVRGARERLEIINVYGELGSYRAAAKVCGTTHKTVKRIVQRQQTGLPERVRRPRSTDPFLSLIEERVRKTQGRISAKRLLPAARAAGYEWSARHFRRAVAEGEGLLPSRAGLAPVDAGPGQPPGRRLGRHEAFSALLRGVAVVALAVRAFRAQSAAGDGARPARGVLRASGRRPGNRALRPDGRAQGLGRR